MVKIQAEIVNGKITYLPVMTSRDDGGVPFVKEWLE